MFDSASAQEKKLLGWNKKCDVPLCGRNLTGRQIFFLGLFLFPEGLNVLPTPVAKKCPYIYKFEKFNELK